MTTRNNILLGLLALLLSSCIDFNDATEAISVAIQLNRPEGYPQANLQGHDITLSGTHTFTAKTDAQGIAHFENIIPDVYNASVSWKVCADEYAQTTGLPVENKGYTISGSLTAQTFDASTTAPVAMATTVSQDPSILIGKVYYQGCKDDNNKNYIYANYLELYNNSEEAYDVAGLYIALLESTSPDSEYPLQYLTDSIVAKQVFRIPDDKPFPVAPGGSVLLANSAVDHTAKGASAAPNLLSADFEAKDKNNSKYENNPAVPELVQLFSFTNNTFMNLMNGGPCGIVIFETNEDVAGDWVSNNLTYRYGYKTGRQYMKIPTRFIIDAVDILKYNGETGADPNTKRLFDFLDAGYAFTETKTGYDGRLVRRKVASTATDGRKILQDTNNSANDFESADNLTPRIYE